MSPSYAQLLAVATGGALGSMLRFWIACQFPNHNLLATASVNFAGSFLLGVILASPFLGNEFRPYLRLLLAIGFCGGFTTFSAFSSQTVELLQEARYTFALLNIAANNLGSILFAALGYGVVRLLSP